MGYLVEKVSYLRGLAEGMQIDEKTNEGKMIAKILDVLEELSSNFEDMSDEVLETESRIDDLEECMDSLCDELDGECSCCGEEDDDDDFFDELDDEDLEDLDFYEILCPHCHEKVYFDEDMIENDNLVCPNCREEIKIEICGEDGCDCGCEDE